MHTETPAFDFLRTRRSHGVASLKAPGPGRASLRALLEPAARVPDHGMLQPWRFVIPGTDRRAALAQLAQARGAQLHIDPAKLEKSVHFLQHSPRLVAVIGAPKESAKVPEVEQVLSAGAVCLSLVNAALATGWGAVWLTTWMAHDAEFAVPAFGLAEGEFVAGLIHIGTPSTPPSDRKRPDLDAITTWLG